MFEVTPREALSDLTLFAMVTSQGKWKPHKHSVYLAERIEHALTTPNSRLIIEIPPRHGKTDLTAIYAPVWHLKRNPRAQVIYCTYGASLAHEKSLRARSLFRDFRFGEQLSDESSAVQSWRLANLVGGYRATGTGGTLTGTGADILIWDDPIKNQKEASSPMIREQVMNYWQYTLRTRLHKGASAILVQTRWHHDDPAGQLKKTGEWEVITLPAIAEDNDPMGRTPGEPLCPEIMDYEDFERTKREVGSYVWNALYQQRPSPAGGGAFKREWFRYYKHEGDDIVLYPSERVVKLNELRIYQTIDAAGTESDTSDYFAALTFGITKENDLIWLDLFRERAETTRHEQIMEMLQAKWKPIYQAVEDATYGLNIIQRARKQGRPIKPLKADKSKRVRAEAAQVAYENGMVYHPRNASWLDDMESELIQFPKAPHDDIVDVVSYAAILQKGSGFKFVSIGPDGARI